MNIKKMKEKCNSKIEYTGKTIFGFGGLSKKEYNFLLNNEDVYFIGGVVRNGRVSYTAWTTYNNC